MTALAPNPAALSSSIPASSTEITAAQARSRALSSTLPTQNSSNAQETPVERMTPVKRRNLGEWNLEKTIGAGSMGKVKLARHHITGEQVSCRELHQYF